MRLIKIAIGSVDPTVGAVRSNVDRMLAQARAMAADGVTIGCFSEQVVGGYPAEDLVQWRAYLAAQRSELERFAAETADAPTVFVPGVAVAVGGQIFNCAAVVHGGEILGFVPKEKLPTYNVFYEARTFSRGTAGLALEAGGVPFGDYLFELDFGLLAVEVCEDVWSPDGPMRRRCYSGAEVVVNVTSSPFRVGVVSTRREMLATRSADNQVTLAYVNTVGAQDGLVFDGGGYVYQNGRLMLEAPRFREGWAACVVDLDRTVRARREASTWRSDCEDFQKQEIPVPVLRGRRPTGDTSRLAYPVPPWQDLFLPPAGTPSRSAREEMLDDLIEALALGVKDYYRKSGAFRSLGIALSGGRDSMLTLLIAWRAAQLLREEEVEAAIQAFYMPTRYSGEGTRDAAATLCRELDVPLRVVPIEEAFDREVEAARQMLGGGEPTALTLQNIQARLRASRMWNWANSSGALFLQTGDMSEKAVGYTTIGGDLEGALSVIANVPKTVVIALLERFLQRFGFAGIRQTLETEPGPELAEAQTAEGELMPFAVLDACLWLYAGEKLSPAEAAVALRTLFPDIDADRLAAWAERFAVLFTRSIYKWVQAPLALHVGSLDLDRERALQLPVVQRGEWSGS
ncbi:MAG TPA: NAD(+) synthase [Thermoanaerobaculia bacterium]|jgi:NAD+ synthase (glutamine-hydrolysing)|nr:NAD(+) synthase [Thermoanaerobaculia bacterium]